MPHHTSSLDMGFRTYQQTVRATVNSVDDGRLMQEVSADGFHSDSRDKIEAPQNYGFSSHNLPRDESKQQSGQQQASGGQGEGGVGKKGEAAEAVMVHPGGNRSHPVAVVIDDRRYRPRDMPKGASFQYDQYGQGTYIKPEVGTHVLALDSEDGKTEKYSSLRHVNKKKQPKPEKNVSADGKAQQSKKKEEFKHEGESVNTEVRCTKGRIEFRIGDEVVAYIDAKTRRFVTKIETRLGSEDADHPVYGKNGSVGMTSELSGDSAVLIKAPQPGPPNSLDTAP